MPTNIRLTKKEEKLLHDKVIEINKVLVMNGFMPVKESELAHIVFDIALPNIKVNKKGQIEIDL